MLPVWERRQTTLQWTFIVIPAIAALIGWFTNLLALKLLFRPYKPWRIPLTPWSIQGVIPRRQAELARSIGEVVKRELLAKEDLLQSLNNPETRDEVAVTLAEKLADRIGEKLAIVPLAVRQPLELGLKKLVLAEIQRLYDSSLESMWENLEKKVDIAGIVEKKVASLDLEEFEKLIVGLAGRELGYIVYFGAVLGFLIGLLQVLLLWFTGA